MGKWSEISTTKILGRQLWRGKFVKILSIIDCEFDVILVGLVKQVIENKKLHCYKTEKMIEEKKQSEDQH